MKKLIGIAMDKARKFTVLDYFFFKITLFALGLIVGVYFASFFEGYLPLIWIVFGISYIIMMFRFFAKK